MLSGKKKIGAIVSKNAFLIFENYAIEFFGFLSIQFFSLRVYSSKSLMKKVFSVTIIIQYCALKGFILIFLKALLTNTFCLIRSLKHG